MSKFTRVTARRNETTFLSLGLTSEKLNGVLLPSDAWKPLPRAADRSHWEALPDDVRRHMIQAAEANLKMEWPTLPATLWLEFRRNGNRSNFEAVQSERRARLQELLLGECAEGAGRFLDDIANGIWATCEETFWGYPAHLDLQKAGIGLPDASEPVVDLFASEAGALLAWSCYLLGERLDQVSPMIRPRVAMEVERRILKPCRERIDFWWMGLHPKFGYSVNNWNPWINSNWLATNLLLESDADQRAAAVCKVLRSLDVFLAGYHPDGGCDEGPNYWGRAGGSLCDCLELVLSASGGALDFFRLPVVREIGRYIYRAHIYNDWFVNYADTQARVQLPAALVFRYGLRIGDENMQALAAFTASEHGGAPARNESIGRHLPALFGLSALQAAPRNQPLRREVWLPGIQVMAGRCKEGSARGLYLSALGGHNGKSHNHNDVGSFIVYADGQPAIIDVGVETYTAKTFGKQRYDIWTMQSGYHNLPTIGGVMQAAGRQFAATDISYRADECGAEFRLNIAGAYPPQAGVQSWERILRLDRVANQIEIGDAYALSKASAEITLTLMTPSKPVRTGTGELALDAVTVLYDGEVFMARVEEISLEDALLRKTWGERLYRILLVADEPPARGVWSLRIMQRTAAGALIES